MVANALDIDFLEFDELNKDYLDEDESEETDFEKGLERKFNGKAVDDVDETSSAREEEKLSGDCGRPCEIRAVITCMLRESFFPEGCGVNSSAPENVRRLMAVPFFACPLFDFARAASRLTSGGGPPGLRSRTPWGPRVKPPSRR